MTKEVAPESVIGESIIPTSHAPTSGPGSNSHHAAAKKVTKARKPKKKVATQVAGFLNSINKRKDVVLKTALRRCRKHFSRQMASLTGYVCSKKPKPDDPLLACIRQMVAELAPVHPKMKLQFFLSCLLFPQDTRRNLSQFSDTQIEKEELLSLVDQMHDVLYKYSHEKLEFFCKTPAMAFLFKLYYENSDDKNDPEYSEGYNYIY